MKQSSHKDHAVEDPRIVSCPPNLPNNQNVKGVKFVSANTLIRTRSCDP